MDTTESSEITLPDTPAEEPTPYERERDAVDLLPLPLHRGRALAVRPGRLDDAAHDGDEGRHEQEEDVEVEPRRGVGENEQGHRAPRPGLLPPASSSGACATSVPMALRISVSAWMLRRL